MRHMMKNEILRSIAAMAAMAWSLGGVLAQESGKTDNVEASKEARERDSSSKDRRVRIMKAFDRNKDGDLNEEESEALRRYIEARSPKSGGEKIGTTKLRFRKIMTQKRSTLLYSACMVTDQAPKVS
jgi:hypothetical protein